MFYHKFSDVVSLQVNSNPFIYFQFVQFLFYKYSMLDIITSNMIRIPKWFLIFLSKLQIFSDFFLMFSICFQYLFTTEPMCVIASPNCMPEFKESSASKAFTLKDLIGDGILWAVPKHRKSIERRLKAKYGHPKYHMKIMSPKTTLRTCMQCGHDHEVGVLCRKCYFPKKKKNNWNQLSDAHMCN